MNEMKMIMIMNYNNDNDNEIDDKFGRCSIFFIINNLGAGHIYSNPSFKPFCTNFY